MIKEIIFHVAFIITVGTFGISLFQGFTKRIEIKKYFAIQAVLWGFTTCLLWLYILLIRG